MYLMQSTAIGTGRSRGFCALVTSHRERTQAEGCRAGERGPGYPGQARMLLRAALKLAYYRGYIGALPIVASYAAATRAAASVCAALGSVVIE